MNLAEFYMDMMSFQYEAKEKEGINDSTFEQAKEDHQQKLVKLEQLYKSSQYYTDSLKTKEGLPPLDKHDSGFNISGTKQFGLLFKRAFVNQVRNPMDSTLKIVQSVMTALVVYVVFGRLNTTDKMTELEPNIKESILQSIRGVAFFLVSFCTFAGIQGTLATFSSEKPMFLR